MIICIKSWGLCGRFIYLFKKTLKFHFIAIQFLDLIFMADVI